MRFFTNDADETADRRPDDDDRGTDTVQSDPVAVPNQRPPSPWSNTPAGDGAAHAGPAPAAGERHDDPASSPTGTSTSDPAGPDGPTWPDDRADSDHSTRPQDHTDPDDPAQPQDHTDLDDPTQPQDHTDSVDPTQPQDHTDSDDPARPEDRVDLDAPVAPEDFDDPDGPTRTDTGPADHHDELGEPDHHDRLGEPDPDRSGDEDGHAEVDLPLDGPVDTAAVDSGNRAEDGADEPAAADTTVTPPADDPAVISERIGENPELAAVPVPVAATASGPGTGAGADRFFSADDAQSFQDRWRDVQLRFVDSPQEAAADGARLVGEAVDRLIADLQAQRDGLTGDTENAQDTEDTEKLRVRLRGHREILNRILGL
jgi:hypothetical protein